MFKLVIATFAFALLFPLTAHSAGKPASKADGPKLSAAQELSANVVPFFFSENPEYSLQVRLKALSKANYKRK